MKKKIALICIASFIMGASLTVSAADVKSLPSPALKSLVAGKTFDVRITGYGWGEEDDPSSLSLDFTVVEPVIYTAAEVEALEAGDTIIAGYEFYTVSSVETEDGSVKVTPEEEWLTQITFTATDDGVYTVENEDGILKADSFSFPGKLGTELVYVNTEGESLTSVELLKDMVDETIDMDNSTPTITFDDNGFIVEVNFGE